MKSSCTPLALPGQNSPTVSNNIPAPLPGLDRYGTSHGPSTFRDAGLRLQLYEHEVDQLSGSSTLGPRPAPATGKPRALPVSADYTTWQQLCHDRMRWDPDAQEPCRGDGESVLMNFVVRVEGKIHCRVPMSNGFCDYSSGRKDRLLLHIRRDHLNLLPFACGGRCGSQSWYGLLYPW